jgi:hypothetical protein
MNFNETKIYSVIKHLNNIVNVLQQNLQGDNV